MSYLETISNYEKQIGKKFTYDDAFKFWNALNEPFNLQSEYHKKCNDDIFNKANEDCKTENRLIKEEENSKKIAIHFFNKTLNNKNLFLENDKKKLLKAVESTKLFVNIKKQGQVVLAGGYYEKYLKYKAKYLDLKRQNNL
jgi:hypothetical protein